MRLNKSREYLSSQYLEGAQRRSGSRLKTKCIFKLWNSLLRDYGDKKCLSFGFWLVLFLKELDFYVR